MSDKIFALDDDPKKGKLCSIALRRVVHNVSAAEDAQKALHIVDAVSIDLALLDIVMLGIDDLELLQLLKKKREDLIVIMITDFPKIETAVKAIKDGAYDYISKPFSLDEIRFS